MTVDAVTRLDVPRGKSARIALAGLFALYAVPNLALAALMVAYNRAGPIDWASWSAITAHLAAGNLYSGVSATYSYLYSPLMAYALLLVIPIGYPVFAALHVAALGLLRDRGLILLALVSWGFWTDVAFGNFFAFVFIAGVLAMRGSRAGTIAYLALFVLMPRPIQVPLVAWLLWQRPGLRWPFAAMLGVSGIVVIAGGWAGPWLGTLMDMSAGNGQWLLNVGPTRLLGNLWLLCGLPLAVYLTLRHRPGLAGLALAPYVIPQYLLFGLLLPDHVHREERRRAALEDLLRVRRDADVDLGVVPL